MTPHDELMALAVAWESDAVFDAQHGQLASAATFEQCAADLRALLDSDAFRAMVRDAADARRYRWLRNHSNLVAGMRGDGIGMACGNWSKDDADKQNLDAAIDAAASGAGEE